MPASFIACVEDLFKNALRGGSNLSGQLLCADCLVPALWNSFGPVKMG